MIGGSGFPAAMIRAIAAEKPLPQAPKITDSKLLSFLSDQTGNLLASGVVQMKNSGFTSPIKRILTRIKRLF
jgi:hypothetical protein